MVRGMSKQATSERGRPPEVAPAGRITIGAAAKLAGVSYATVYRAVKSNGVRHEQAENGVIYVFRADLGKLRPVVKPIRSERPSVTVRLEPAQLRRWQAAAGNGKSVSRWLTELGDKAAAK